MENNSPAAHRFKEPLVIIGLSVLSGLLFWVADSLFAYKFFHRNLNFLLLEGPESFMEALVLKVPLHSLFVRCSFLAAALAGGCLTAVFLNKKAKSDAALKSSEAKYRGLFETRKKAEEELKNSLSLLSASLESTADGILIVDRQRKLSRWNRKFAQMWNIPDDILLRHDDQEAIHHILRQLADPEQFLAKVVDLYTHPDESSFDQIDFLDGRTFERYSQPQKIDGAVVGRVWSFRDITDRKAAEKALRESNEKFVLAFNNAPIMIAITRLEDGAYLDVNRRFLSTLGFSREEVIGKTSLELGIITQQQRQQILETITTSGRVEELDLVMFSKSRKEILCKYWGEIITISNTKGLLSISLDISEHRRIEQQLRQTQRIESIGRLAGGVAHDFNNMLAVILGHTEMAMDLVGPNQPLYADLEEIRRAANRSADLTRQLLAFARRQTVAPKVLDLNETIEGLLKMLRRLIGEGIDVVWMPRAGLWPVNVDPSQIDQMLTNLCLNARDAIAGVGKITVETGNRILKTEYHPDEHCSPHMDWVAGEYVWVSVSDNGCGIDQKTMAHLFEPFFTTKDVGAGTGLGLATVYGAVKQNNGFVDVYSEPGLGTIFTIYLPRYRHENTTAQATGGPQTAPALAGDETILLVEDEPTLLGMATMMLQQLGYVVLAANTPGEALRLAEQHAAAIHLVITDVVMPEMNGRDLAERLLGLKKGMKCLFMSGYTSDIITNQGILDEGMNFIQKPFSQHELAVRIRKVLSAEPPGH